MLGLALFNLNSCHTKQVYKLEQNTKLSGHQLIDCKDAQIPMSLRSIFFQMSQNGVCILSVFEQKMCPYNVCIFVHGGPFGKVAVLN